MKYIFYISTLFLILVTLSCKDDFTCAEFDEMPKFDELVNIQGIKEESGVVLLGKEDPFIQHGQTFAIYDQSTYDELINFSHQSGCTSCNLPEIDLTKRTLIGLYVDETCGFYFFRNVSQVSEKEITFTVKAVNLSQCEENSCINDNYNWVSIPKISKDIRINFVYKRQGFVCDCK